MLADQIERVIQKVIASHEFKELVTRTALEMFGPKLADLPAEPEEKRVNGIANCSPEGLAVAFHGKLSRRPWKGEDLFSLAGQFDDLIKQGIPGQRILDMLNQKGRNAEFIVDFCKRVRSSCPVKVGPSAAERAAATAKRIAEEEGRV